MPNAQGRRKAFSRVVGDDQSVLVRARFVGDDNAAGTAATAATIQNRAAGLTFAINTVAEGLNDYTGFSGSAGQIQFVDTGADSIRELLQAIHGIAPGQTANRRWRAAQGDFPELYTLDATTGLVTAAGDALVGPHADGLSLFADTSAITNTPAVWVGVGTERGLRAGGGLKFPDYFEDYPGTSGITGFSSNTPDRTRQRAKQNDESVFVGVYTPVITYVAVNIDFTNNDTTIRIWDNSLDPDSDTPLLLQSPGDTSIANGVPVSVLLGGLQGGFEFRGTPGEPLFVEVRGTGGPTFQGGVVVGGYYELSLNRAA